MAQKNVLMTIKNDLDSYVGYKIRIRANRGRKKVVEREGVLEKTYPSIFLVKFEEEKTTRRATYSYSDLLTDAVELVICKDKGDFKLEYNYR